MFLPFGICLCLGNNLPIEIKTENLRLLSRANEQIEILPPFSSREIPLHLSTPGFFSRGRGKVTILANKQQFEYNIAYESFVIWNLLPILGGLALTVFALILVRQAIFKFRRKTSNKPDDQEKPFKESSPTTRSLPF